MLTVILLSLAAVIWYGSEVTRQFYLAQKSEDLNSRIHLVEGEIAQLMRKGNFDVLNAYCRRIGNASQTRITVIALGGRVLADSVEDPHRMENHAGRPEVKQVLAGGIGRAMRYSHTLDKNMLYVAVALQDGKDERDTSAVSGVLRMSLPLTGIEQAIDRIYYRVIWGTLAVALLATLVTLMVSRRVTRPFEQIRKAAQAFARGDFSNRIQAGDDLPSEVYDLVATLNRMVTELDERIRTISGQRNELRAVFGSMVEGVIAVDRKERILSINPAAESLLGIEYPLSQGKKLLETIRHQKLSRFVSTILQGVGEEVAESEIIVTDEAGAERTLHARGTMLRDAYGKDSGALMVFDDVTTLRKLENVRRDFVANVSHELRTPVTTIKGFVETLLDGDLHDEEQVRQFLGIVQRNVDRLNAIINDLLMLSRLEQEDEKGEIELRAAPLCAPLAAAIEACTLKASEKNIAMSLSCPPELQGRVNAPLLEQAVVNLIINAIKYSEPGKEVLVSAVREESEAVIRVRDFGVGIAREHLPRLFERFYRSDKARSRKLGGTGLGLAIVKHIVQAHGGSVSVESKPGEGSQFSLRLPCEP